MAAGTLAVSGTCSTFLVRSPTPTLGVLTIAPVGLVMLWVFGIVATRGISFDPFTAMITIIAIGAGVPHTIRITHRYQQDRIRHDTPEEAIRSTTTHTGGSLADSAVTTAAGFGVLAASTLEPFQQFDGVTFWAITFAFVASVLVLPSLLIVGDRRHLRCGHAADKQLLYALDIDELIPD